MVEHVRRSFSEILHELPWLEDDTKKVAQEKVCKRTALHLITVCTLKPSLCCQSKGLVIQLILSSIRSYATEGLIIITSGHRTRTVQSYLPGCAGVLPCKTCFLRATRVRNPDGISNASAVFGHVKRFAYAIRPLSGMSLCLSCLSVCL